MHHTGKLQQEKSQSIPQGVGAGVHTPISSGLGVGVVVIGRNEGDRLKTCLGGLINQGLAMVYVDSGSEDGSVAFAQSLGVSVVVLDLSLPFTAARARNEGFAKLMAMDANLVYVQFVDGDCELIPRWFKQAVGVMNQQENISAICGRLRERHPQRSVYNRLCEMEWDGPVGEIDACGGISMMRVSAFKQVGGFDNNIIAAEDNEICVRLKQHNGSIQRINVDMAWHDAQMHHFWQWWQRAVRAGHGFAQGSAMHGKSQIRHFVKESRRTLFWGCVLPATVMILALPSQGWSFLLLLLYPLSLVKTFTGRRRQGDRAADAWCYAWFATLSKFPGVWGMLIYHWRQLWRRQTRIIEYK